MVRVGVIFGGQSGEHEVSLKSAQSVMNTLQSMDYDVVPIGITKTGHWIAGASVMQILECEANQRLLTEATRSEPMRSESALSDRLERAGTRMPPDAMLKPLDVVIPVLHGPYGEDGTIQGLLELAHIPYVGCGVLASSVGMDKIVFKQVMAAQSIQTAPYLTITRSELPSKTVAFCENVAQTLGWPVFCKPANMGSSVGITKCHSALELQSGLREAARFDRRILVESAVPNAREIEVSVLGNEDIQASIPGEIIPSREFYDYQSKYIDQGDQASRLIIPAKLPPDLIRQIQTIATRAFKAIDGSGMARVDFLLEDTSSDSDDHNSRAVYLNEINTIPGFTSISMYSKLWEASGLTYPKLLERLIQLAIERFNDRQRNQIGYDLE